MQKWIALWTFPGDLSVLVVRNGRVFNVSERTRQTDRYVRRV